MHYIVDGYNLLFQGAYIRKGKDLEAARTALIHNLDNVADARSLHITIVFDAPFQSDDLRRGHFNKLEIVFTSKGQTADEYIADYVQSRQGKEKLLVVTSDKGLTRRVKGPNVYTQTVADFLEKVRKKARPKQEKKQVAAPPTKKEPLAQPAATFDPKNLPPLSDIAAWEQIFLGRLRSRSVK